MRTSEASKIPYLADGPNATARYFNVIDALEKEVRAYRSPTDRREAALSDEAFGRALSDVGDWEKIVEICDGHFFRSRANWRKRSKGKAPWDSIRRDGESGRKGRFLESTARALVQAIARTYVHTTPTPRAIDLGGELCALAGATFLPGEIVFQTSSRTCSVPKHEYVGVRWTSLFKAAPVAVAIRAQCRFGVMNEVTLAKYGGWSWPDNSIRVLRSGLEEQLECGMTFAGFTPECVAVAGETDPKNPPNWAQQYGHRPDLYLNRILPLVVAKLRTMDELQSLDSHLRGSRIAFVEQVEEARHDARQSERVLRGERCSFDSTELLDRIASAVSDPLASQVWIQDFPRYTATDNEVDTLLAAQRIQLQTRERELRQKCEPDSTESASDDYRTQDRRAELPTRASALEGQGTPPTSRRPEGRDGSLARRRPPSAHGLLRAADRRAP